MNRALLPAFLAAALAGIVPGPGHADSKLYWLDSSTLGTGNIMASNVDGTAPQVLATVPGSPTGLSLDAGGGKMYWSVATTLGSTGRIQRADLDGGNVETIVPNGTHAQDPVDIAVDPSGGAVYWLEENGVIYRANLDGSSPTLFTVASDAHAIAVDAAGGYLYGTVPAHPAILRWPLGGGGAEVVLSTTDDCFDVTVDPFGGTITWTEVGRIMAARTDGTDVHEIAPTFALRVAVDLLEDRLVAASPFTGTTSMDLDGGDAVPLGLSVVPSDLAVLAGAGGLRRVYWTEETPHRVLRASLDGSGAEELVNVPGTNPFGLTIDPEGGRMYWGDRFSGIRGANLDGSDLSTVIPGAGGSSSVCWTPVGANWVYWLDDPKFFRAPVDNPIVEEVGQLRVGSCIGCNDDFRFFSNPSRIYSTDRLAQRIVRFELFSGPTEVLVTDVEATSIEVDIAGGKIYWGDETGLRRANLDGSSIQMLVPGTYADRLALDFVDGKIYWNTLDEIWRADLDGGNARRLLHDLVTPSGLALHAGPRFDDKIYWADLTNDWIRRVGIDGSNPEVVLDNGLLGPQGIAHDPLHAKMYWSDVASGRIQRSNLDGSCLETVLSTGLDHARDLAIDWYEDKVYWVDRGYNRVGRADTDGQNFEILYTGVDDPKGMDLDLTGRKIYWGDNITNRVARGDMDGSGPIETVVSGTPHPYGIALDLANDRIYWTDDIDDTIERAYLDGTGREVLVSGLVQPLHLSLDVPAGKMYWIENSAKEIQRADLDGTNVETISSFAGTSAIGIFVITSGTVPVGAPEIVSAGDGAALRHPFPNPFRNGTSLALHHAGGALDLAVYDVTGRLVQALHRGPRDAGDHVFAWDGRDRAGQTAAPGVYFFRLRSEAGTRTVKGILLR